MNKYMSLESKIRSLGAKGASQPLEKDMNDQVHAGSYTSKNFEVSRPAQKLFASLPKSVSTDDAQKSLQLHDQLFDIHKKVKASGRASPADIDAARMLHDKILKIARNMDLEDQHGHVKDSLDFINSKLEKDGAVKTDVNPSDAEKRFGTPPKDYQSDVKSDSDIDNIAKFKISRDKNAQRKLKIIDDEFKLGETQMVDISDAIKQVLANEQELAEKKKMTKADIAALKEPKGSIDADDLAALRAGEHKKKMKTEEKEESAAEEKAEKKHNNTPEGVDCPVCGKKACPTVKEETIDEAMFVVITKGSERKRIRNNPIEIGRARKEGWAITEELVSEASPLKTLGTQQKKATIQREVQQKKAMYSKKDAVDKQKFSKSMQKIHAGDEVEMNGEQIDEAAFKLSDAHKSAITKHLKNNYGKGKVTFHSEHGGHFATHSDGIQSTVHHAEMKNGKLTLSHFMTMDESVAGLVAGTAMGALASYAGMKSGLIQKGVDKATSLLKKKKKLAKEEFMERAIAILGEDFADMSFEQLVEEVKKARGRPRKHPAKDPNAPKRPRGRPKKGSSSPILAKGAPQKAADTDKDREHIVMGLRKAISLRGDHHVKFADGSSHKISAEHAQRALKMHDSLSRPSEKMVFARKLAASHDSFKNALSDKSPGSDDKKKVGITLAKRAD